MEGPERVSGGPGAPARPSPRDGGYTLVAVVIGMLILSIAIAAVGPALGNIGKRDRELELIFRGKQYSRGIRLFQRRYGRYPNSLKEMAENNPRTIRKLWKDPMCNCDNWHLVIMNTPEANPQLTGLGTGVSPDPQGKRPTPVPTPGFGSPTNAQMAGPIVGVRSNVHKESLQEFRGQRFYDAWVFRASDTDTDSGGTGFDPNSLRRPGGGVPGQPTPPGAN
ncbi:MAG: type II secretion system protein [Acidobacteriota bacterium]